MTLPRPSHESPASRVLSCLERVRRSQSGWTARCPAHEDRFPSLRVDEGEDGRVLLYCYTGCTSGEIVAALGLEMRDLFPAREPGFIAPIRGNPDPLPRSVAQILAEAAGFPESWVAAKEIAKLEPELMKQDVLDSWDYLSAKFDIPALLELARLVRGVAFFRYGDAKKCEEPGHVARCVDRLVEELRV